MLKKGKMLKVRKLYRSEEERDAGEDTEREEIIHCEQVIVVVG